MKVKASPRDLAAGRPGVAGALRWCWLPAGRVVLCLAVWWACERCWGGAVAGWSLSVLLSGAQSAAGRRSPVSLVRQRQITRSRTQAEARGVRRSGVLCCSALCCAVCCKSCCCCGRCLLLAGVGLPAASWFVRAAPYCALGRRQVCGTRCGTQGTDIYATATVAVRGCSSLCRLAACAVYCTR